MGRSSEGGGGRQRGGGHPSHLPPPQFDARELELEALRTRWAQEKQELSATLARSERSRQSLRDQVAALHKQLEATIAKTEARIRSIELACDEKLACAIKAREAAEEEKEVALTEKRAAIQKRDRVLRELDESVASSAAAEAFETIAVDRAVLAENLGAFGTFHRGGTADPPFSNSQRRTTTQERWSGSQWPRRLPRFWSRRTPRSCACWRKRTGVS